MIMGDMTGRTVSHYTILEKLGEGGMGVVYKAEDTKLKRMAALKFLPEHIGASDEDKSRFLQEAQAAAALNHPNICTIYGIEEHDGQTFIAMEFIDGQTLREKKAGMSYKQSIDVGIQLADGLAIAHEHGVVHRDIKPDNIMIRKDGIAQIMDFGLAKLRGSVSRLTKQGSTVGTAGYMSPEQVQGLEADHRSDIFSLGVVLYELFTGQLPFKGVHETALAYEIVNVDPAPMASLKPEIDPNLDAIVLECLAKEPDERTQSAKQVSVDLKRYRRESSRSRASRITAARPVLQAGAYQPPVASDTPAPAAIPAKPSKLPWMVSALFLLIAAAASVLYFTKTAPALSHPIAFTLIPPASHAIDAIPPVISPDGERCAFVARDTSGRSLIWIRNFAFLRSEPLAGTEDASYPFWSPDNHYLAFFQDGKLRRIDVGGGPVQSIADAPEGRGGSWGSKGVIVFAPNFSGGIYQVPEAGGTAVQVTSLDTALREETHRWPYFLPDGRRFLYMSRSSQDEKTGVYLCSLDSKERPRLAATKSNAVYAAPGYLIFIRENSLMAQPFNASGGDVRGEAFPIASGIGFYASRNIGLFSASASGTLTYLSGEGESGSRQLVWYDRSGKRMEKIGSQGDMYDFALSPDEKRVVFRRVDPQTRNQDLWILDVARRTESRFTFSPATEDDPVWSPDGTRIAFDSNRDGIASPYVKIASGAGSETLLWKAPTTTTPLDWSPDGKYLLLNVEGTNGKSDLYALPFGGDKKPFPVVQTEANEDVGKFSPDGRWVAYQSDESGKLEVYVQAFPVSEGKWQVSVKGGGAPQWSRDGKELYYISPERKLMAVDVRMAGSSFEPGIPKPLFSTTVDTYLAPNRFAATRDGKRFLVNSTIEADSTSPIIVVLNWTAGILKK
jgi:serine/threonine protein kinase